MVTRKALRRTGSRVIVKPFVVLAARCLGPGPVRLQMVKLAHDLGDGDNFFEVVYPMGRHEPGTTLEASAVPQPSQPVA